MDGATVGLVVVILLTVFFDYTNGFHDASNAIASAVSTRALSLRSALILAGVMNLLGALLSTGIAVTVAKGLIEPPPGPAALSVVFAALVGAVAWNLITWYFGLPSSSSHALVGGLVGAALASAGTVHWGGVLEKVLIPMVLSPAVGLVLGYLAMVAVLWALRRRNPHKVGHAFRRMQILSAASLALGHGLQDAQKGMGIIVLALVASGHQSLYTVPLWVTLLCAVSLGLGTYSGGLRIMRTLGRRVFPLDPPHGFVAEAVGSSVLYLTAFAFHAPVSTTHVITSAVMGVGATRRLSAVRWGVARDIVLGWVLTFPAAAAVAALAYGLTRLVAG
ncbi:PiT family inorganic phosphate transporter [Amycolatopsis bartoniae]|uniref:Inorganic phosphate transporter n=1 Tax=Amycolatopsis bartoniae TaxID=941986 RepID=A0A8H9IYX9_9PSEU|nr:inorganic phosphate transporter [Amycolatopsis bartoniae]MBB2937079.1 PiT family inorganic phosphate transporter [Amycolatopsis bartoniae]GHF52283.1 inorganic phosphate transporter [Amycolatopsis bartoniae]